MRKHEFFGSAVEAQIQHRPKGKQISNRKNQIQGDEITQHAVDHRGQRCAADGCRLDESENGTSVSSGRASMRDALKTVLPAQLAKEARNAIMHKGMNCLDR